MTLSYHAPVILYAFTNSKLQKKYNLISINNNEKFNTGNKLTYSVNTSYENHFPKYNLSFHPYFFAWKIELIKVRNLKNISLNINENNRTIPSSEITPNTLYSRLFFISKKYQKEDNRLILYKSQIKLLELIKISNFQYILIYLFYFFSYFFLVLSANKKNFNTNR